MKHLLVLFTALSLSLSAWAQAPTPESVEKLLQVTQSEKIMDQMFSTMDAYLEGMVGQTVNQTGMDEEARQFMDKFMKRMMNIIKDEMSWGKIKELHVQIYREHFTQQEVNDMLAFYETSTGQAVIQKMPAVMHKAMELTQARLLPLMQRIQTELREAVTEAEAVRKKKNAK